MNGYHFWRFFHLPFRIHLEVADFQHLTSFAADCMFCNEKEILDRIRKILGNLNPHTFQCAPLDLSFSQLREWIHKVMYFSISFPSLKFLLALGSIKDKDYLTPSPLQLYFRWSFDAGPLRVRPGPCGNKMDTGPLLDTSIENAQFGILHNLGNLDIVDLFVRCWNWLPHNAPIVNFLFKFTLRTFIKNLNFLTLFILQRLTNKLQTYINVSRWLRCWREGVHEPGGNRSTRRKTSWGLGGGPPTLPHKTPSPNLGFEPGTLEVRSECATTALTRP